MSAPRVLVSGVLFGQPMGGVRRHNQELLPRAAERLLRVGGSLTVLEGDTGSGFALPETIERIPSRVPAHPLIARALAEGRALRRTLQQAARSGAPFHLVHTAHLPAPRGIDVPLTFTLHDPRRVDLEPHPLKRLAAARAIRFAFKRAACVIAVSETMARRYRDEFEASEVRVVPNAADHLPLLSRAPSTDPFLLHVGHLEARKNLELLIHTLAYDTELPRLVFAGASKGNETERLRNLAQERRVSDRTEFLGRVSDEDLASLYAQAACVVLPSHLEGFGIPVLEAQRAAAPLAISEAGALPEVAGAGVPSFPLDDPQACARAVRAAMAIDPVLLCHRAEEVERFSWDASADKLVELWLALTA